MNTPLTDCKRGTLIDYRRGILMIEEKESRRVLASLQAAGVVIHYSNKHCSRVNDRSITTRDKRMISCTYCLKGKGKTLNKAFFNKNIPNLLFKKRLKNGLMAHLNETETQS